MTNGKFPELTEPDESYHGVKYVEAVGPAAYITKARVQLLRDLAPTLSPFNAFLLIQGLETLHLRMERHSTNGLQVAEYLENHPTSAGSITLIGVGPNYAKAQKYLAKGCGQFYLRCQRRL